jgi:hypothetical protein
LALAELHLASCVRGDDGSNALVADGEDDLCEKPADLDLHDLSDELIAAADLTEALSRLLWLWRGFEQWGERASRNKVVTAGRLHARELARENPLLDRRVAKAEFCGCFTGLEERVRRRNGVTSMLANGDSVVRPIGFLSCDCGHPYKSHNFISHKSCIFDICDLISRDLG